MIEMPTISTERAELKVFAPDNAAQFLRYLVKNKERFAPWEPTRDAEFFSQESVMNRARDSMRDFENTTAVRFVAIDRESGQVAACCNFTNILKEPILSSSLGYSICADFEGKGYMFEVAQAGIGYLFDTLRLHRITAAYMPHNQRSEKLLQRLGFEREGYAKSYLRIAGKWEDMIICTRINHTV